MRTVFADTNYWIAILHPKDQLHEQAKRIVQDMGPAHIVTTEEVLIEFLAFFAGRGETFRDRAARAARVAMTNPNITVLPQTHESFVNGLTLFEKRNDKEYSVTDCISMEVLRNRHLQEVLTSDHHFTQEGFKILLASEPI